MTCGCFANPSSLGVTEPFLTQKKAFILKVLENQLGFEYATWAWVGTPYGD